MAKYAVYTVKNEWLFDVEAASEQEAIVKAKGDNPDSEKVEMVSDQPGPRAA